MPVTRRTPTQREDRRLILDMIVVEDMFLALYLALLQPVLGGAKGAGDAVGQLPSLSVSSSPWAPSPAGAPVWSGA
jgi:hypothetical protein